MNLFLAKAFMADITRDGRCEITGDFGFVRAKTILNTKSPHDFRWSVMLASGYPVDVGIMQPSCQEDQFIHLIS